MQPDTAATRYKLKLYKFTQPAKTIDPVWNHPGPWPALPEQTGCLIPGFYS
jgi:hypothetical protein